MEKVYRFAAKNKRLFRIFYIVVFFGLYIYSGLILQFPTWLTAALCVICLMCALTFPDASVGKLMDTAIKELNDRCDPFPLLQEAETQLTYQNNEAQKVMLSMSRGAALASMGEKQRYYDILTSINIDKSPSILPQTKFAYYHDLASVCFDLGDMEQAKIWHAKARMLYEDMKESKIKESLRCSYEMLQADQFLFAEEYDKAFEVAKATPAGTLYAQVCKAFFCAELCLKLERKEAAKEYLQFVITNGNKLHLVQQAKELMEQHDL